jgi:CheY-like chemotaxis protein
MKRRISWVEEPESKLDRRNFQSFRKGNRCLFGVNSFKFLVFAEMSIIEIPLIEIAPTTFMLESMASVLVVDDDIAMCRILHRMLSDEQYKVQTCQSVADALVAIEQKPFDVFVIDYKLPDGSGLDVAERIRSKWGATPIILISGYNPSAVALRAEKLQIFDFLEKPFSREIIRNAVKKAIGAPKVEASEPSPPVSPAPSKRAGILELSALKASTAFSLRPGYIHGVSVK